MNTYGFPTEKWNAAKAEAREAMIGTAMHQQTISYADLVEGIHSIHFLPHDFNLFHLLGQVSKEESEGGRGMLSAVVVRKEDGLPGQGFFDLAKDLGRSVTDQDAFWINEVRKVYSYWGSQRWGLSE